MANYQTTIDWAYEGTVQAGGCQGAQWAPANQQACPAQWTAECYPIPTISNPYTLPYTAPPATTFLPQLQQMEQQMQATYQGGNISSQWALGGYVPQTGEVVRVPVCYWEQGGNLNATDTWSVVVPQSNLGPALVVNYVITASVDQTYWDFGDATSTSVTGAGSQSRCSVQHTYYHVSADVYGSHLKHTPPSGQTWTSGDEPQKDQIAVEAWHHVGLRIQAYFVQPDGAQVEQDVPSPAGFDFWVADTPEWVTVYQIESIPIQCPCPGISG